jgi:hypothetical protein
MNSIEEICEPTPSAATFEAALTLIRMAMDPKAVERNVQKLKRLQSEAAEFTAKRAADSATLVAYELQLNEKAAKLAQEQAALEALVQQLAERERRITDNESPPHSRSAAA